MFLWISKEGRHNALSDSFSECQEWRLFAAFGIRQPPFQVMEAPKRDRITEELTALEEQLKGASQETKALEKANYFAGKESLVRCAMGTLLGANSLGGINQGDRASLSS